MDCVNYFAHLTETFWLVNEVQPLLHVLSSLHIFLAHKPLVNQVLSYALLLNHLKVKWGQKTHWNVKS